MKFTLTDCMARINQVLNYPALAYGDIYHFFDQAIAELNTNLRIALPSVSEMRSEHTFDITEQEGFVRITKSDDLTSDLPDYRTEADLRADTDFTGKYAYVCAEYRLGRTFYKHDGDDWKKVDALYGMYVDADGNLSTYTAVPVNKESAYWVPVDKTHVTEFELTEYLPIDWWTLFIIPYVCFKFAVRNGDSGELFVDEYTQGYQQLQSSYNVPNVVKLSAVAGRPAYTELVKQHLACLGTTMVFTRAIYEDMRVGNGIASVYGGFYETGGWGV